MNKKRERGKGKKPKWAAIVKSGKRSLNDVAAGMVEYMELTKASRNYLKATKRFRQKIDFRLKVESEFCYSCLIYIFKVSKTFIAKIQQAIHEDENRFEADVKRFSNGIIPEQPAIVTKNLVKEMEQIIGRNKSIKTGKGILV